MRNSKADARNVELLKLIAQLRHHLDIHRIIGLNLGKLRESRMSAALLGYLQKSAHEALAIYICKIFRVIGSKRVELDSWNLGVASHAVPVRGAEARLCCLWKEVWKPCITDRGGLLSQGNIRVVLWDALRVTSSPEALQGYHRRSQ